MSVNNRRPVAHWVPTAAGVFIVARVLLETATQAREFGARRVIPRAKLAILG